MTFGLALAAMCWLWMDPVGIARAGFDAKEFAGESFNFLYTERTQTLNWPTWVLYLIDADLRGVDDASTASPTCSRIWGWRRAAVHAGLCVALATPTA